MSPHRFYAHSTDDVTKADWQPLLDHLTETAELAERFAASFGCGQAARLAGLLHDLGKYSQAFQARLSGGKTRVDHATAGAKEVLGLGLRDAESIMAQLVAYAVAGHHTGLPDRRGGAGTLEERIAGHLEPLDPVWKEELALPSGSLAPTGFRSFPNDPARLAFQFAFLGRMLFSCLVDADFRNTEAFYARHEGYEPDRAWPALQDHLDALRARLDADLAGKRFDATMVNRLRARVLDHVRAGASREPGLFTLTVPTGGGKTLASLAFALDHAKAHGHARIIYAIPFTSIIDQTAAIFREVLGADFVLEHHSAIDEEAFPKDGPRQGRDKLRLAMEDWAAPVVVTTNVQFLESLFSHKPSRCRKLHNIAKSVIVLDEAQAIPLHVLRPAMAAIDELARNYGCTIVLCTATQPALGEPEFKPGGLPLAGRELAPDPKGLAAELTRTTIDFAEEMNDERLVAALRDAPEALVVVNGRAHALALFQKAKEAGLEGVLHLTTRQYAVHRQDILADIRRRLDANRKAVEKAPCRVIATSLIEAGVDISFPRVWRAMAGLDSIIQAAGRCGRNGELLPDLGLVTVFVAPEFQPPSEVKAFAEATARVMQTHADHPDSLEAIRSYFLETYWQKGDGLDRTRHPPDENGRTWLKVMESFSRSDGKTDFLYRKVGENFRLIEEGMVPVIVARSNVPQEAEAVAAIQRLERDPNVSAGAVARILQRFTVQVPPKARNALLANGHATFVHEERFGSQFAILRSESFYKDETGLLWENADYLEMDIF